MSLDQAIKHNKEHRKQYYGAKEFDRSCRNHGGDEWCKENRMIHSIKELQKAKHKIKEAKTDIEQ